MTTAVPQRTYVLSKETFLKIQAQHKANPESKYPEYYALYAMVRNADWRKGLTAPSNKVKVENGAVEGWCARRMHAKMTNPAPWWITFWCSLFNNLVTEHEMQALLARIPKKFPHDGRYWTGPAYTDLAQDG